MMTISLATLTGKIGEVKIFTLGNHTFEAETYEAMCWVGTQISKEKAVKVRLKGSTINRTVYREEDLDAILTDLVD